MPQPYRSTRYRWPMYSSSRPVLASTSTRRQFQSCDHCRNRRKKCDAGALAIDPYSASHSSCTACAKVGQTCTFEWLFQRKRQRTFVEARNANGLPLPRKKRMSRTSASEDRGADDPFTVDDWPSAWPIDPIGSGLPFDMLQMPEADSHQQQDQRLRSTPTTLGTCGDLWDFMPFDWSALLEPAEGAMLYWVRPVVTAMYRLRPLTRTRTTLKIQIKT